MSLPDGFALPLTDEVHLKGDMRRSGLPVSPPPSIPVARSEPAPSQPRSSIPVAPPDPMPMQPPTPTATVSSRDGETEAPTVPADAPEVRRAVVEQASADGVGIELSLDEILLHLLETGGSDLHLTVNAPPLVRILGELEPVPGHRALTAPQLRDAVYAILTESQRQRFEESKELDLAYELPGTARFRVNLMQQQGSIGAVLRAIPWEIPPLESLGLPSILEEIAALPRGLVLVTGPPGSGRSTTLAALIDKANRTRKGHIITIEDPVEFVHQNHQGVVTQREIGRDTLSLQDALKHVLRQDPDIILVGELLDLETITFALTAAETGHLVLGTLQASTAATTIDRIVDVFAPKQQSQIRTQLASTLKAVVCQTLCPTSDGQGRVAATEVLLATPAVRSLIREGKLQSIPDALQAGSSYGMQTLDQDLARLVEGGAISYEVAQEACSDVAGLNQLLGRGDDAAE